MSPAPSNCTAFAGDRCIASGDRKAVALAVKRTLAWGEDKPVLIFEDGTGKQIDFDLSGTPAQVLGRLSLEEEPAEPPAGPRGRGRPKLGVVPREVTLLPRHWEWLSGQPGGASVALRKLVEAASRGPEGKARDGRDAAYRFIAALAGDFPGFEEAARALYARDAAAFEGHTAGWASDVRAHARRLAGGWLAPQASGASNGA